MQLPVYTNPDHIKFVEEMQRAGLTVTHYRGRNFYEGPAVEVDDVQDAIRKTTVPLRWDNLGKQFIAHPAR